MSNRLIVRISMLLLPACLGAGHASAASFDCGKAGTRTEKLICANAELSQLDAHLGRHFSGAQTRFPASKTCLRDDQRTWLRDVRDTCTNATCLRNAYLQRLAMFDGVQAGASALKNIALPAGPSLRWVLPPAQDNVAAPPLRNAKPLVVRGQLRNAAPQSDGRMASGLLIDAGSKQYVLTSEMFWDDATQNVVDGLPNEYEPASARYEVRGFVEPGATQPLAFAASRCRFIYRLP